MKIIKCTVTVIPVTVIPYQATIDSALLPQWGNTARQVSTIRVPAGTTIYDGAAAAQGGLVGGGSQVVIPRVNPSWVVPK